MFIEGSVYPELDLTDYKSIRQICLPTSYLNVLIGANGVGKTNLVEAVVLATCVEAEGSNKIPDCFRLCGTEYVDDPDMLEDVRKWGRATYLHNHIYTLEERAIRLFSEKRRIEMRIPEVVYQERGCGNSLVSNGANLYEVLVGIEQTQPREWLELQSQLGVIFGDWFDRVELCEPTKEKSASRFVRIDQERVLIKFHRSDKDGGFYTRHSVSSGFLKVLAMLALLFSKETPKVIAIENFGEGLNPKLSCYLVGLVASLAKRYNRQVFLTTHDVSVLDGVDLVEEFLFVVSKDRDSDTRVKQIKIGVLSEKRISKLSETWLRGSLGAMPKMFDSYYRESTDS